MLNEKRLSDMVVDLKKIELYLDEIEWQDEDKILQYNELQDEILIYLKEVL